MKKTINVLLLIFCCFLLSGWKYDDYLKAKNNNGDSKLIELLKKSNKDGTTGISCEYRLEKYDPFLTSSDGMSTCESDTDACFNVCAPASRVRNIKLVANTSEAYLEYTVSGVTRKVSFQEAGAVVSTKVDDSRVVNYNFYDYFINENSATGCYDKLYGELDSMAGDSVIDMLDSTSKAYYTYSLVEDKTDAKGNHPGAGKESKSAKMYTFGYNYRSEMHSKDCCSNLYIELGITTDDEYYITVASKPNFSDSVTTYCKESDGNCFKDTFNVKLDFLGYKNGALWIPTVYDDGKIKIHDFKDNFKNLDYLFPSDGGQYQDKIILCDSSDSDTSASLNLLPFGSSCTASTTEIVSGDGLCSSLTCNEDNLSEDDFDIPCKGLPPLGGDTEQIQEIKPINLCEKPGVLQSFKIIGYILFVAKIAIPLILIVMATLDLAKAVISGDDKANSKAFSALVRRIALGVIIFFIPTAINFVFSLIDDATDVTNKYTPCTECLFEPGECNSGYLEQITDDKYVGNADSSPSPSTPSTTTSTPSTPTSQREYIWPVGSAAALPDGTFAGTPVSTRITSYFGNREQPVAGATTDHGAIDIGVAVGTPVIAVKDGKVVAYANNCSPGDYSTCDGGSYGNYLKISHGNSISTLYAHLKYAKVGLNEQVKQGQLIGYSGNTGRTTGPHLHFEVRNGNTKVDPLKYVSTTNPR